MQGSTKAAEGNVSVGDASSEGIQGSTRAAEGNASVVNASSDGDARQREGG
jgi:hypothetical protein